MHLNSSEYFDYNLERASSLTDKNDLISLFQEYYHNDGFKIDNFDFEIVENILGNKNCPIEIMQCVIDMEHKESILLDEIVSNPSSTHKMHIHFTNDLYFCSLLLKNPSVKKCLKLFLSLNYMNHVIIGFEK